MSHLEPSIEKADDGVLLCPYKRFLNTFPLSTEKIFYRMIVMDKMV